MKGTYGELNKIRNVIDLKQNDNNFHPLTCDNDSKKHSPLVTSMQKIGDEFELFLICNDCNWKQDVPKFIKNLYLKGEFT